MKNGLICQKTANVQTIKPRLGLSNTGGQRSPVVYRATAQNASVTPEKQKCLNRYFITSGVW